MTCWTAFLKILEAVAFAGAIAVSPSGVLDGINEALRVGHQAEDQAGRVADAGDVVGAAVGVVGDWPPAGRAVGFWRRRARPGRCPKRLPDGVVGGDELPFAVGDRAVRARSQRLLVQMHLPRRRGEVDPAVDEPAAVVVGEGAGLPGPAGEGAGEQFGFDQHLEAVADADDRLAGVDEPRAGRRRGDGAIWLARIRPAAMSSP